MEPKYLQVTKVYGNGDTDKPIETIFTLNPEFARPKGKYTLGELTLNVQDFPTKETAKSA